MSRRSLKRVAGAGLGVALLFALPSGAWAEGAALLERAFSIRYDCDTRARVRLDMRDGRGAERSRELYLVTKYRDDRMHSIGRLLSPQHLRGMTLLSIEAPERVDDVFVYLPSLGKSRRISRSRRGDSFLGSDLTYRDFERHRASDYPVLAVEPVELATETARRVSTRPADPSPYDRVDFLLADRDLALLEISYLREGRLARRVRADRASIVASGGHLVPQRLLVENLLRGTSTSVTFVDLEIDPDIDDRIFSVVTLEAERPLGERGSEGRARGRASPD